MRALWIEDHQLIGDALEELLHVKMPEISLDKARDLDSAVAFVQTIHYELVLLDWWLGEDDGEKTFRALREAGCKAPVIVVSHDESGATKQRAMAFGAFGYVTKSADPQTLIAVIRGALPGVVAAADPPSSSPALSSAAAIQQAFPELTARQADVFVLLIRGLSDKQIARELGISDNTVKTHVRAILQALGVSRRGEAAHAARTRGAGGR